MAADAAPSRTWNFRPSPPCAAALPIVILLFAAVAGSGLDTRALDRSAIYLVIGVAAAQVWGSCAGAARATWSTSAGS